MRRLIAGLAWIVFVQLLTSCAIPPLPTDDQMARADYGDPPKQHEKTIREYFASALRDPYSVVYKEITQPEKGVITNSILDGRGSNYGWLVNATINAKNLHGGYVGYKTYNFLFRGEELIKVKTPDSP